MEIKCPNCGEIHDIFPIHEGETTRGRRCGECNEWITIVSGGELVIQRD